MKGRETQSLNWRLKLRAPFRAGACRYFRRAIDFAGLRLACQQATAAHSCVRRCSSSCGRGRQRRRTGGGANLWGGRPRDGVRLDPRRQIACRASCQRQNKQGRCLFHDLYLVTFLDFCVKGSPAFSFCEITFGGKADIAIALPLAHGEE
jgi:hypothetical protein